MKYCFFILITLTVFVNGCVSDYHLAAIKEARLYAIKEHPDLSEESIHWIRFTTPEIRQEMMFPKKGRGTADDFAQTCIIWNIPEYEGKSLVVVGYGEKRLKDWYPIKAFFKRYRFIEPTRKKVDKK